MASSKEGSQHQQDYAYPVQSFEEWIQRERNGVSIKEKFSHQSRALKFKWMQISF